MIDSQNTNLWVQSFVFVLTFPHHMHLSGLLVIVPGYVYSLLCTLKKSLKGITLTKGKDLDETPQNAVCLLRYKQYLWTEVHLNLERLACGPLLSTMNPCADPEHFVREGADGF